MTERRSTSPTPAGAPAHEEAARAADAAGLVHVTDELPGIRRRRRGRGFSYAYEDGRPVRSPAVLERIRALVIPPAWTDVWICGDATGHLQATGRDVRHRKQYRYHDDWRTVRDADKFDRLHAFGTALGPLRQELDARLDQRAPRRDTVLAAVVHLLDDTLIRVGNAEYAHDNETYGLTTLRERHADVGRRHVELDFVGKHGQHHHVQLEDPRLVRIVRRCHELGGKELFTYADEDGRPVVVTSADVNDFLRDLTGTPGLSAKDFRTWGGTVTVTEHLALAEPAATEREVEEQVLAAIDVAAERLHNTRAVCRSSYVHPAIPDAHRAGEVADAWKHARSSRWYDRAEHATLHLLAGDD